MDESALLKSAKKMDPQALFAIFDTYAPGVFRYCFRLWHDAAESDNVVEEVFEKLLENLASGEGPAINLRSYIFQITYQTISDRLATGRWPSTSELAGKSVEPRHPITTQTKEAGELEAEILTMLNTELNMTQRHVILLRYLEDFSVSETAFIVGKSVSNVKVIQTRAMAKLSRKLDAQRAAGSQSLLSGVDV